MAIVVNYLNYVKRVKPKVRTLAQVALEETKAKAEFDEKLQRIVEQFEAMRDDMISGSIGFKYDIIGAAASRRHDNDQNINISAVDNNNDFNNVEMLRMSTVQSENAVPNPLLHRVWLRLVVVLYHLTRG